MRRLRSGPVLYLGGALLLLLGGCASAAADGSVMARSPAAAMPLQAAVDGGGAVRPMPLGHAAPAPLGYLRFCARRPDQCGPEAAIDVAGDSAERQRQLLAKYYWAVVFHAAPPAELKPTYGGDDDDTTPARRASPGAYDARPSLPPSPANTAPARPTMRGPGGAYDARPAAPPHSDSPSFVTSGLDTFGPDGPLIGSDEFAAHSATLTATPALMATLDGVNLRINNAIRYMSDIKQFGVEDYWTLPLDATERGAGDCKDYVLEKRRALVAGGLPERDLSIAIVRTAWGETHAVLLVSTDRGELVLDSLSPRIVPWTQARYTWVERQAPGRQLAWVTVDAGGHRS